MCLSVCLAASSVIAQTNISFDEYDLDNGLHVILHKDPSTPIVAVSVMYHVGSKNENPERTGFAHFFEHLLFEGSENIERGEYDNYVESAGGALNANTTNDRTYYYEVLPSNQLELGLWLESERMLHAKVEDKGIETQRQVVKEERRQRVDNQPYGSVLEETFKRAFTKHPYKWPVIGSMAHLDAATENDYKSFYETFYVPNNAVLSIAGDIDIAQAKKWVAKYFGTIPRGTNPVYVPTEVEAPLEGEVRDVIYDNIQLPAVIHAYRIPAIGTEDYYAIQMLNTILSQGESSRMNKSIVDEQEKALVVFNVALPLEHPGLTLTYAIAGMGVNAEDLETVMDLEVDKVKNELITEREFEKIRNQKQASFINKLNGVAGIAESLANYHMYLGDANLINTELERFMAVTREDIQHVAKKYLSKDNRVALYYLPKTSDEQ